MPGVFTFEVVKDLYTLNFEPSMTPSVVPEIPYLQYFLLVFPILMLTSNFPIIAITLTNNLRALIVNQDSPWWFAKVCYFQKHLSYVNSVQCNMLHEEGRDACCPDLTGTTYEQYKDSI